jgi:hypothetical protein
MNHQSHDDQDQMDQLVVYPRSQPYCELGVDAEEFYALAALADYEPGIVDNVS